MTVQATAHPAGRLILDVSSLARWSGPPVGIARVEHALAARALGRPDAVLAFYDPVSRSLRRLRPEWLRVVGWDAVVELSGDDDAGPPRRGWRRWAPSRRPVVAWLERRRLTATRPVRARLFDAAQRAVLAARRHRTPVATAEGHRIDRVPSDLALGEALTLGADDVILAAGSGWSHLDLDVIAEIRSDTGCGFATLCYDLIPLTHPQFWLPEAVRRVAAHWRACLKLADLVIVNAACIERDVRVLAESNGLAAPAIRVLPLGADPPRGGFESVALLPDPLPAGLQPQRYALFVSTIEPRKGHATLLAAWRTLLARGIPQQADFRLVFVGRDGWMVEAVLRDLADPALAGSVVHLRRVGHAMLDALYAGAAFVLYPSVYEGFGLPVIEAFARGKAVLASTGGALPETVAGLSPCLPPGDVAAWAAALAEWIADPTARAPWEARIRRDFARLDWADAADAILDAAMQAGSAPRAQRQ